MKTVDIETLKGLINSPSGETIFSIYYKNQKFRDAIETARESNISENFERDHLRNLQSFFLKSYYDIIHNNPLLTVHHCAKHFIQQVKSKYSINSEVRINERNLVDSTRKLERDHSLGHKKNNIKCYECGQYDHKKDQFKKGKKEQGESSSYYRKGNGQDEVRLLKNETVYHIVGLEDVVINNMKL
uniref:CCHC-type domain-containing protein n=1 Tax=Strongyloides venezuelensis TaxID=75913 RepID=A0A0K0FQY1_STRVS